MKRALTDVIFVNDWETRLIKTKSEFSSSSCGPTAAAAAAACDRNYRHVASSPFLPEIETSVQSCQSRDYMPVPLTARSTSLWVLRRPSLYLGNLSSWNGTCLSDVIIPFLDYACFEKSIERIEVSRSFRRTFGADVIFCRRNETIYLLAASLSHSGQWPWFVR